MVRDVELFVWVDRGWNLFLGVGIRDLIKVLVKFLYRW